MCYIIWAPSQYKYVILLVGESHCGNKTVVCSIAMKLGTGFRSSAPETCTKFHCDRTNISVINQRKSLMEKPIGRRFWLSNPHPCTVDAIHALDR